jgi:hypothetical protein
MLWLAWGVAGAGVESTDQPPGEFFNTMPLCTDLSDTEIAALSGTFARVWHVAATTCL